MNNTEKIKNYFNSERAKRNENSQYYINKSKNDPGCFGKKYYEDQAWIEGVKVIAILNQIEKDVTKLIKEA